ncbi:MAG: HTH domain-containing protein [Armatimonadetes bacterium]|nr:HTH domain-containing protein [Armatimonadota bacterium]
MQLLRQMQSSPNSTFEALAESLGVSRTTVRRHVRALKSKGLLRRVGSKKSGYWEVTE